MANVSEPTIWPSTRAMNSELASDSTNDVNSAAVGGGFDEDNCGMSRSKAVTNSSSTVDAIVM
jgi:hypothetical protein